MKSAYLSLSICLAALSPTMTSFAQSTASASEAVRADFRKAQADIVKGNYESARALLVDLYERSPTFDVAGSLADAESRLGDHASAARHYALALARIPPKEKAETTTRLQALLDAERARVATLKIAANRTEAEVFIDGQPVGTLPQTTEVYANPGRRTVELRSGGASVSRIVDAAAGATVPLTFEFSGDTSLEPAQAAQSTSGERPNTGPAATSDRPRESANWLPFIYTAGAAVVAVGVGTAFAIDAGSAKSDGERKRADAEQAYGPSGCSRSGAGSPICSDLQDLQDRRQRSNTTATVSFVVGGVFAAAAIGSYFLWVKPGARSDHSARVGARIGARSGSLLFEGSF